MTISLGGGASLISRIGGGGVIPELSADPSNPNPQQAWVLAQVSGGGGAIQAGMPLGLLLALTYSAAGSGGGSTTYQFSYRTLEGTTIRATLA